MTDYITLKLFASLKAFMPANPDRFPIAPGTTVGVLIESLGLPVKEVKLVFVNGVKQERNVLLKAGDRVGVFPAVGGG